MTSKRAISGRYVTASGWCMGLAAGLLLGTGCDRLSKPDAADTLASAAPAASGGAVTEVSGAAASELEKDAQLGDKLNGYVDCLNSASRSVYDAKDRYATKINPKTGPTGKEGFAYIYEVKPERCIKELEEAKAKQPALPELEALAVSYSVALKELAPLTKQANDYFSREDYKDDKWAKAKAFHAPLMAAFSKFEGAHTAFDAKVKEINGQLSKRRLARLEKDPAARLQYLFAKTVDEAEKVVDGAAVKTLAELNGEQFQQQFAAYEKSFDELRQYMEAHAEEAGKVSLLSSYTSHAERFLKAAKELVRRKRDNKDFRKESGNPDNIEGHPSNVISTYNSMIQASNSVNFDR